MLRRYIDEELNTIRGGSGGDPATEGVVVRILVQRAQHYFGIHKDLKQVYES